MNTLRILITALTVLMAFGAQAQNKAYQRKKPVEKAAASTDKKEEGQKAAAAAKGDSEKLDIQDLEEKYWAPKDTDFSVVQNRTYTKSKRYAASFLMGPPVNDPFNSGLTYAVNVNYYFDERYGVELMMQKSEYSDSDATNSFKQFAGGGTRPDFNRETSFYGVGFNWVPFYAKMSFLGKKIIYFDMQVTPFVGVAGYQQLSLVKNPEQTAFAYGFDVTQYFFFSNNFAVRANLHNRFYTSDVLAYTNGTGVNAGDVKRSGESTNATMFLMGITYFF